MSEVKYFTKKALIEANREAIRTKRNRTLEPKALDKLRPDLVYPITFSMIHNDCELRVSLVVGDVDKVEKSQVVWLDIPFETYNNLPTAKVEEKK